MESRAAEEGEEPSQHCKACSRCTAVSSRRPVRLAELQYCKACERGGGGGTALSFLLQVGEAAGGGARGGRGRRRDALLQQHFGAQTTALPARRADARGGSDKSG